MPVMDSHFSTFADGGDLQSGDTVVGLRGGVNTRFINLFTPNAYLPLAGGTMAGGINMAGFSITGLPAPTLPSDAVDKAYVDAITGGSALTRVSDTNVTLTLGGTPATSLLQAVSLTLGWTGQLAATRGGTGIGTYTLGDTLYSSASNTLSKLSGNTTIVKQYLSQTGDGVNSAAPSWATVSGGDITGAALSKTDDTNVTLTLGGTPTTALLRAASLTLGWTGTLALSRGGTAASLTASNGGIVYSTASAMGILAGTATANQILMSGSSTTPAWSTATYPATTTVNQLLYSSSANVIAGLATGNSSVLVTSAGGVPSLSTTLPAGLTIPGYQATITPAALTKTDDTNVTLTLGGSPTVALLAASSLTLGWTGQLAITRGGTGVSSVTITPTASAWAGWDANKNISANRFGSAYRTTATAASTTTLSVTDAYQQYFTGSTTQTVVMPVASTIALGDSFYIVNNSTGVVTVQSSGGNTIQAMAANTTLLITCILSSGTTAASWNATYGANFGATLPAITTSSITFSPTTGGIVGTTTNDNAAAGKVGEFISSIIPSASGVVLTNNTIANVTSISLTAGDWDVWGNVTITALSVSATAIFGWISSTSASAPDSSLYAGLTTAMAVDCGICVPSIRFSLGTTTTIFLSINVAFTGNAKGCGGIYARRRR